MLCKLSIMIEVEMHRKRTMRIVLEISTLIKMLKDCRRKTTTKKTNLSRNIEKGVKSMTSWRTSSSWKSKFAKSPRRLTNKLLLAKKPRERNTSQPKRDLICMLKTKMTLWLKRASALGVAKLMKIFPKTRSRMMSTPIASVHFDHSVWLKIKH